MNKKDIVRDEYIRIKMSKEEKALWLKYCEEIDINPTRYARNILMQEAECKISKVFGKVVIKGYKHYCEITNNHEALARMKSD